VVDNAGDSVTELAGRGSDSVETTLASTRWAPTSRTCCTPARGLRRHRQCAGQQHRGGSGNDTLSGGRRRADRRRRQRQPAGRRRRRQLDAGTGSDIADGGAGSDTLTLLGNFADYTRSRPNATDTVLTNTTTHESITVRNVEKFLFADGDKALGTWPTTRQHRQRQPVRRRRRRPPRRPGRRRQMAGGLGNDTYTVDQAGDKVIERPTAATTWCWWPSPRPTPSSWRQRRTRHHHGGGQRGGQPDRQRAGQLADRQWRRQHLIGGAGNDTLDGGAGADKLIGGLGDDLYLVDNAGDVVTELAGRPDRVETTLASYTLGANVEDLLHRHGGLHRHRQ
jgi:hypothetical protein